MKKQFSVLLILWVAMAAADEPIVRAERFSDGDLQGWETQSFAGTTEYTLVETEDRQVLRAVSRSAASGMYQEITVDLKRTPYLASSGLDLHNLR